MGKSRGKKKKRSSRPSTTTTSSPSSDTMAVKEEEKEEEKQNKNANQDPTNDSADTKDKMASTATAAATDIFTYTGNGNGNDNDNDIVNNTIIPKDVHHVVVSDSVTEIPAEAFLEHPTLTTITIPATTVTKIGKRAFCSCPQLRVVKFIVSAASNGTDTKKDVAVFEEIGDEAFLSCGALQEIIDIPSSSIKVIGNDAFGMCSQLTQLKIITSDANDDDDDNNNNKSHHRLERIGNEAFAKCESLEIVDIPAPVHSIGSNAFQHCSKLTTVILRGNGSGNGVSRNGSGGGEIGREAFKECSALTTVDISMTQPPPQQQQQQSIKIIGEKAFQGCTNLKHLKLRSNQQLEEIGSSAFRDCTTLETIHIPPSVKTIGTWAFSKCRNVTKVTLSGGDGNDNESRTKLEKIGLGAFEGCVELTSISIPPSVKIIDTWAFSKCTKLATVNMPENGTLLEEIGKEAFKECSCEEFKTIHIPASVKDIGDGAFSKCRHLTDVTFAADSGGQLGKIGGTVFSECTSLKAINVPACVTEIGEGAFSKCETLTDVRFVKDSQLAKIGPTAFEGCLELGTIEIPESVKIISSQAFLNCDKLSTVILHDGLQQILANAFAGCRDLCSIDIPASVKKIGKFIFLDCPYVVDRFDDLKGRFDDLPLHQVCYNQTIQMEDIQALLDKKPLAAEDVDAFGMTALHLLACGANEDIAIFEKVLETNPGAVEAKDYMGRCPVDVLVNRHLWEHFDAVKDLCTLKALAADNDGSVPLELALSREMPRQLLLYMFSISPVEPSQLRGEMLISKLTDLRKEYVAKMTTNPPVWMDSFDHKMQHGWVTFTRELGDHDDEQQQIIDFITNTTADGPGKDVISTLAYARDSLGRTSMDIAATEVRTAFEKRLLFLERYEIMNGPPVHISDTCILLKALDRTMESDYGSMYDRQSEENEDHVWNKAGFKNALKSMKITVDKKLADEYFDKVDMDGDNNISRDEFISLCNDLFGGHVALKFMKERDQFEREKVGREDLDVDYVIGVFRDYTADKSSFSEWLKPHIDKVFKQKEKGENNLVDISQKASEYKYLLVFPFGDRNLDTIFRSERPNMAMVRAYGEQIGEALDHLHSKHIIHGDIKLHNVVRYNGKLRLIDLDASWKVSTPEEKTYIGSKFSSGILPPEMIFRFKGKKGFQQKQQHESYFNGKISDSLWQKNRPVIQKSSGYIVKSFCTEEIEDEDNFNMETGEAARIVRPAESDSLPYGLVEASPAFDIWSFGTLLYTLCTGVTLFKVNRDDDLADFQAFDQLYNWEVSTGGNKQQNVLDKKLLKVKDAIARDLLAKMLERDPARRFQTMKEVLQHEFFTLEASSEAQFQKIQQDLDTIKSETGKITKIESNTEMILANQAQFAKVLEEIHKGIDNIPDLLMDLKNIQCPYMFMIVGQDAYDEMQKQQVDESSAEEEETDVASSIEQSLNNAEKLVNFATTCIEKVQNLSQGDVEEEDKEWFFEKVLDKATGKEVHVSYLQVLCGRSLKPVITYKVEDISYSDDFKKIAAWSSKACMLGVAVASLYNSAALAPKLFGYPVPEVPTEQMEKIQDFFESMTDDIRPSEDIKESQQNGLNSLELEEFRKLLEDLEAKNMVCQLGDEYDEEELQGKRWQDGLETGWVLEEESEKKVVTFVSRFDSKKKGGKKNQNDTTADTDVTISVDNIGEEIGENSAKAAVKEENNEIETFKQMISSLQKEAKEKEAELSRARSEAQKTREESERSKTEEERLKKELAALKKNMGVEQNACCVVS